MATTVKSNRTISFKSKSVPNKTLKKQNSISEKSLVTEGLIYNRSVSSIRTQLENKLIELYGHSPRSCKCSILTSGMQSIYHLIRAVIHKSNFNTLHFAIGNEMYCDTGRTFRDAKEEFKTTKTIEIIKFDVRNSESIIEMFRRYKSTLQLFFIESCTNPSGQMFDFTLVSQLKKIVPHCIFCVDNTWLSCKLFNPFRYGVDIVLGSMTKYVSGGKCIGGFVIGKQIGKIKKIMNRIADRIRIEGIFVGSDHCQTFINGLNTMHKRLYRSTEITLNIANFLESKGVKVMYPLLRSNPRYNIANKFLIKGPSVLFFHYPCFVERNNTREFLGKIVNDLKCIKYETSFGSSETKIDCWPKKAKSNYYDQSSQGADGLWIRLAIGYNSNEVEIINDLVQLLDR